ncbi:hypothetical protein ACEWY4_003054 [Coilia grayii]|uniref:Ig-like domain-containing protein n=1 Tax=Coilia grayii TaxID=363190 RepID=A0ABD1KQ68_9TELE
MSASFLCDGGEPVSRAIIYGQKAVAPRPLVTHGRTYRYLGLPVKCCPEADSPSLSGGEKEVRSGDSVTVSCSVSHSCPPHPPTFTWSHNGNVTIQSEALNDGQHKLTSSLTFTASANDHQKPIICSAQHHGGKTASSSRILKVLHAPVNVTIDPWEPSVLENGSTELRCSAVGNPVVSSYRWSSESGRPPTQGAALTLPRVSRNSPAIRCIASNSEGESTSRAMTINVEFPPEVSEGSFCRTSHLGTQCSCTVLSNPSSTVKWIWDHNNKESPRIQNGSVTMAMDLLPPGLQEVACFASNKHGNTVKMLHVKNDQQYVHILVGVISALALMAILTLIVLGLRKCCRKQQKNKEMGNPVYDKRYSREGAGEHPCSKQKEEDVYGNDDMTQAGNEDIYANTAYGSGADTSDDIYANY